MEDAAIYVDALAWWLHEAVGPSDTFETLSYIGIPDIRGAFVFLAAIKCGYKVRPILDPHVSELKPKRCFYLLQGIPLQRTERFFLKLDAPSYFMRKKQIPVVEQLIAIDVRLDTIQIPSLDTILGMSGAQYPYTKSFAEVKDYPIVVLHSSGSTGKHWKHYRLVTSTKPQFQVYQNPSR